MYAVTPHGFLDFSRNRGFYLDLAGGRIFSPLKGTQDTRLHHDDLATPPTLDSSEDKHNVPLASLRHFVCRILMVSLTLSLEV